MLGSPLSWTGCVRGQAALLESGVGDMRRCGGRGALSMHLLSLSPLWGTGLVLQAGEV